LAGLRPDFLGKFTEHPTLPGGNPEIKKGHIGKGGEGMEKREERRDKVSYQQFFSPMHFQP